MAVVNVGSCIPFLAATNNRQTWGEIMFVSRIPLGLRATFLSWGEWQSEMKVQIEEISMINCRLEIMNHHSEIWQIFFSEGVALEHCTKYSSAHVQVTLPLPCNFLFYRNLLYSWAVQFQLPQKPVACFGDRWWIFLHITWHQRVISFITSLSCL